ncbi:MAG: alpha-L-rhamnosidase C-terminal domain-containing protein, partial [Victivallaceae bacterium]|nr:alpha-L-rhamnosidase C-terminal domain-containing protein [Victivallaceae bacterium]
LPFAKSPEQSDLPYFSFLFAETMFALGQTMWMLEYLKDYWMRRIDKKSSAWLVRPDAKEVATTDFFRGNTISPNIFLLREVAGVRIAEPGYTTIYFNPAIDFVKWAKLLLPTVYGSIRVEWERMDDGSLEVIIDAKFPIKVLPELSAEILKQTTFNLGKSVTLLDFEAMPE